MILTMMLEVVILDVASQVKMLVLPLSKNDVLRVHDGIKVPISNDNVSKKENLNGAEAAKISFLG